MMAAWRDWQGQVVAGKYPLQQYLGGHPASAVFATESDEASVKTAIKLVPDDPATAEIQLARWREAAHLSHPHLLRLFDSGRCELDGTPLLFVLMERAEDDLSQVLPDRALTETEVRELLMPTLGALDYLHRAGFVHGHLNPSNIMSVADQLKISGDPLYRAGDPANRLGNQGPAEPPEKAQGPAAPAWDVWSAGTTLIEALTQRAPALEGGKPVVPETLPAPFREIVLGCLERDGRWSIQDITARLEGRPVRQPEPERRRVFPLVAAGIAIAAALYVTPKLVRKEPEPAPAPSVASEMPPAASAPTAPPSESPRPKAAARQEPPAPKAVPEKRPEPPAAPVHRGPASGGEVLQQVMPDVLPKARGSIQGKVKINVKVAVDASGKVVNATHTGRGGSKYFTDLAIGAARKWTFRPPQAGGRDVESEWLLRFEFTRAGAKVDSQRTAP